ncbi:MAG: hypothetical protein IPH78_08835 [Bacteroidetes bacterium]|nr:hypothetical protein [Bacteroidota bacterium]
MEQDLHFIKPFESSSQVYMLTENGCRHQSYLGHERRKQFYNAHLYDFMGGMDGMVGKDFEKGLAKLKTICESAAGRKL